MEMMEEKDNNMIEKIRWVIRIETDGQEERTVGACRIYSIAVDLSLGCARLHGVAKKPQKNFIYIYISLITRTNS